MTKEEIVRAKAVDLIFIPPGMKERCANCRFIKSDGFCAHPKVRFTIEDPSNECCGEWDNDAIDRSKTQGLRANLGSNPVSDGDGMKFLLGLLAGYLLYQYLLSQNVSQSNAHAVETGAKGVELLLA